MRQGGFVFFLLSFFFQQNEYTQGRTCHCFGIAGGLCEDRGFPAEGLAHPTIFVVAFGLIRFRLSVSNHYPTPSNGSAECTLQIGCRKQSAVPYENKC